MSKINDSHILRENTRPQDWHYWDATLSQMTRLTTLDHPRQSLIHICSIPSRFWVLASPPTRQSSSPLRNTQTAPEQAADRHGVGATHAITGHIFHSYLGSHRPACFARPRDGPQTIGGQWSVRSAITAKAADRPTPNHDPPGWRPRDQRRRLYHPKSPQQRRPSYAKSR